MSWNMIFVQQIFVFCYFGSRGTSWNSIEYSLRIAEMMTNIMWSTYWSPHQIWLSFIGANMGCGNVFLIFWRWREMACDGRGGSVFSFPAAEKNCTKFLMKTLFNIQSCWVRSYAWMFCLANGIASSARCAEVKDYYLSAQIRQWLVVTFW